MQKEEKALKIAPKTYRDANNDLRAAENMIQQSPRNAENYKQSIATLDKSSKLLSDVMAKFKSVAKGASEEAALELVYQERKLGLLSERTSSLQNSLTRSESNLGLVSGKLKSKTSEALRSRNKVRLQESIESCQKQFL
jgi:chromosome segregation ATPase